jgi:hypothetical protein
MSEADPCLFIKLTERGKVMLSLYVDDGLVAATNADDIKDFMAKLQHEFKITQKSASFFLRI